MSIVDNCKTDTLSQQITTITFFRYDQLKAKIWAFKMMRDAHADLNKIHGLQFYTLMGSGKGIGFNPFPDWSVYCLIQTWEDEILANNFFQKAPLFHQYLAHGHEIWTIYMRPIKAHGAWSGQNPFKVSDQLNPDIELVSVITRATIKTSKLAQFWSFVPNSQKPLLKNDDLIYTKGIGEVPIVQMATFSLWKNGDALKRFAYQSREHQEAIKRTRRIGWYKEELFARFQPYKSIGRWTGINLESLFKAHEPSF